MFSTVEALKRKKPGKVLKNALEITGLPEIKLLNRV